jgi:hydroxyacylglutathione hydrolase
MEDSTMQLTEQLFWYPWQGRANNCNSYLLKGKQTILFDPGHIYNEMNESCLEILTREMAADGFEITAIDLVLCTHGHPDHVESAGLIRNQSGARFAIHQADQFIIDAITQHYASNTGKELPSLKADFYLQEGLLDTGAVNGESEKIEVLHTPGHSPGCVCFYLPDYKALVSGDTIFEGSIGRTDFPGGSMELIGQSVDKLALLEGVELLLPGHMGCVTGAAAVKNNFAQIKRYFFG